MKLKEKFHSWTTKMRVKIINALLTRDVCFQFLGTAQARMLNCGRAQGALAAYREVCNYIAQTQDLNRVKEYAKNRYNQQLHHNGIEDFDGGFALTVNPRMRKVETKLSKEEESALRKIASSMVHL